MWRPDGLTEVSLSNANPLKRFSSHRAGRTECVHDPGRLHEIFPIADPAASLAEVVPAALSCERFLTLLEVRALSGNPTQNMKETDLLRVDPDVAGESATCAEACARSLTWQPLIVTRSLETYTRTYAVDPAKRYLGNGSPSRSLGPRKEEVCRLTEHPDSFDQFLENPILCVAIAFMRKLTDRWIDKVQENMVSATKSSTWPTGGKPSLDSGNRILIENGSSSFKGRQPPGQLRGRRTDVVGIQGLSGQLRLNNSRIP